MCAAGDDGKWCTESGEIRWCQAVQALVRCQAEFKRDTLWVSEPVKRVTVSRIANITGARPGKPRKSRVRVGVCTCNRNQEV